MCGVYLGRQQGEEPKADAEHSCPRQGNAATHARHRERNPNPRVFMQEIAVPKAILRVLCGGRPVRSVQVCGLRQRWAARGATPAGGRKHQAAQLQCLCAEDCRRGAGPASRGARTRLSVQEVALSQEILRVLPVRRLPPAFSFAVLPSPLCSALCQYVYSVLLRARFACGKPRVDLMRFPWAERKSSARVSASAKTVRT